MFLVCGMSNEFIFANWQGRSTRCSVFANNYKFAKCLPTIFQMNVVIFLLLMFSQWEYFRSQWLCFQLSTIWEEIIAKTLKKFINRHLTIYIMFWNISRYITTLTFIIFAMYLPNINQHGLMALVSLLITPLFVLT